MAMKSYTSMDEFDGILLNFGFSSVDKDLDK